MLKTEVIIQLRAIGIDELLSAASDPAERDFKLPAKKDFKLGKDIGIEIMGKLIVKKYSLSGVNAKDPEKVIAALDEQISSIIDKFKCVSIDDNYPDIKTNDFGVSIR